jgi:hypothetical protein
MIMRKSPPVLPCLPVAPFLASVAVTVAFKRVKLQQRVKAKIPTHYLEVEVELEGFPKAVYVV